MLEDLRYALRSIRRNPILTAFAVVSLALGIGANASIFSLLDQVVWRMLPVKDPQRLVILHSDSPREGMAASDNGETVFSYPVYKEIRDRSPVFEGVAARASSSIALRHGNESERASAELVSGNLFEVLGVQAALGRTLTPEDDRSPGVHPVLVLTHGYYTRRFGANPSILNQAVQVNGHAFTVIGVLPQNFRAVLSSSAPDVMIPIAMKREVTPTWDGLTQPRIMWLNVIARLKPGIGAAQGEAALTPVFRAIQEQDLTTMKSKPERFRERFLGAKLTLRPGGQGIADMRENWQTPLYALMGMVGFVLLIACANVANLLLAKAATRKKEIALRSILGASRSRIIRLLLTESLLLAIAGAALGLIIASWTTAALLAIAGEDTSLTADLNPRVLAFTAATALLTGILFGLAPAFRATRTDYNTTLKEQGASVRSSSDQSRFRQVLVAAQMALCLVLLTAAGLFATNLYRLLRLDPGFRTVNILQFHLAPKLSGYDHVRSNQFYRAVQERLNQLPGVTATGAAGTLVLSGSNRSANVTVDGYRAKEDESMDCHVNPVGPGYFKTLGIPLLAGREFTERDDATSPKTAIVNQTFARYFFPNSSPIGRRMTFGSGNVTLDREIVGVVQDSKNDSLLTKIPRLVYLPYPQDESLSSLGFYIRTSRDATSAGAQVRASVRELDANIPVFDMMSLEKQLERSVSSERMLALLSNAFGALAALLAAIGLYGVISHSVAARTGEIGIRVALGAQRSSIISMVLREVGGMAAAGLITGAVLSLWLAGYLESQLHQMKAHDPLILTAAALLLAFIALLAGGIPALRASRIDPMSALRHE